MGILRILLIVVEVATSLLLIGVILLQKTKSEGLGLAFGAGMGETLFGSRAGNVLTKITVILAMVFLANTTILGVLFTNAYETSIMDQRAGSMQMPAPAVQQSAPAPMVEPLTAPTLIPAETPTAPMDAPAVEVPVEQPQP